MIKMNSISGLVFFVEDISKTTEFYEKLGFQFKDATPNYTKAYLNWFWMEFVLKGSAEKTVFAKELENTDKGSNLFVEISVQNVDEFYEFVTSEGLKPTAEPKDFPWGRREFILRDPDGYKLVFFSKK